MSCIASNLEVLPPPIQGDFASELRTTFTHTHTHTYTHTHTHTHTHSHTHRHTHTHTRHTHTHTRDQKHGFTTATCSLALCTPRLAPVVVEGSPKRDESWERHPFALIRIITQPAQPAGDSRALCQQQTPAPCAGVSVPVPPPLPPPLPLHAPLDVTLPPEMSHMVYI